MDNKIMMVPAPSDMTMTEVVTSKPTGLDNSPQPRPTMGKFRSRLRMPHFLNLSIIIIVGLVIALIEFGIVPHINQGFICRDPKISYPFKGDTVSMSTLLITAYIGPILIIMLVEILKENSIKKLCVGTVWKYYKECLIGATLVLLITEIMKVLLGEPRPHFLDSCEPNVGNNCTTGSFVFDYECTNKRMSNFFRADITRSFPSGHTSLSLFIALYCSYLIQKRVPSKYGGVLLKPFLIAVCLTWSLTCSLTRITDRRHHWWDVLGGAFLAVAGAFYTLSVLHHKEKQKAKLETEPIGR